MDHRPQQAYHAEQPARRVFGRHTGNYDCAHGRVAYREQHILCPEGVYGNVRVREVKDQKQKAQSGQSHGEYPQRPGQPCSSAVTHPADSLVPIPLSLLLKYTLQHYRLLNVTTKVTSFVYCAENADPSKIHHQRGKRCMLALAKSRADFSRWCALPVIRPAYLLTHPTLPFVDRFMPLLSPSKQVSASHRSECLFTSPISYTRQ